MEKYTAVSVRQLKNGSWQARLKYKENGKWKNLDKVLKGVKGKRDANREAENLRRELNGIPEPATADKTVDEVCLAYYDYQLSMGQLERSSYNSQLLTYNKRVSPYIGSYSFASLDRTAIIAWHTQLAKEGLSPKYIADCFDLVKKTYNYYMMIGTIVNNPFNQVKKPQYHKARVSHLTTDQAQMFLSAVYQEYDLGDPYLTAYLLAYYAGLRRGEICGLRWRDIDLTTNTISITSAIGYTKDGSYTKAPKTPSSVRRFPIVPQLVEVLKYRYDMIQPEMSWFVVGEETTFMTQNQLTKRFHRFVEAYGLKDAYDKPLILHALRHQFAYTGVRAGVDISSLSAMLGHSNIAMTLNTYSDASEESKALGALRLANAFKKTDLDT